MRADCPAICGTSGAIFDSPKGPRWRPLQREDALAKIVRMVAEVLVDKCTGRSLCARVCPTSAFVVRDRLADEPGRSRKIVELDAAGCYNAQRCLEICPEDAIRMLE